MTRRGPFGMPFFFHRGSPTEYPLWPLLAYPTSTTFLFSLCIWTHRKRFAILVATKRRQHGCKPGSSIIFADFHWVGLLFDGIHSFVMRVFCRVNFQGWQVCTCRGWVVEMMSVAGYHVWKFCFGWICMCLRKQCCKVKQRGEMGISEFHCW